MATTLIEVQNFAALQAAVAKQFAKLATGPLYRTTVDPDVLWQTYLDSFPEGSNPIYRTRTEYDCSCCRSFIRNIGGVVGITGTKLATLWDFAIDGPYGEVAKAIRQFVGKHSIKEPYLHTEPMVGTKATRELLADKTAKTWDHFYVNLPKELVKKGVDIGPALNYARTTYDVLKRALNELKLDDLDAVLELIAQNSLYRGEENKFALQEFRRLLTEYQIISSSQRSELFIWKTVSSKIIPQSVTRIRNTAIGSLLVDLAEGKDIDVAVGAFEAKVAPANYKRPTAVVTKAMIAQAQAKVVELGLHTALERRYATLDDLTVNNVLFADRGTRRKLVGSVFEDLSEQVATNSKKFDKVEEIGIQDFITKVLPTAQTVEVLLENQHSPNFVSLIAPVDPTAQRLFKWSNGFSWSYTGDLADSIKARVKAAGGNVTGDFRASLRWWNYDDLDLHLVLPGGVDVGFQHKLDSTTGTNLDVDMNAGVGTTRDPVENIVIPNRRKAEQGTYRLYVHNYHRRDTKDQGFECELEFDGVTYNFTHPALKDGQQVNVCTFQYDRSTQKFTILTSLPTTQSSKTIWGLPTQLFHKVRLVALSPNYWDGQGVGNKHFLFMLDNCVNPEKARGFYNEFLLEELNPHRKVLEMVGAKMRTDESTEQLSGLGFSSTQRAKVVCRVTGATTRTVKVVF